jgi:CheY-like chemotaxis protein
MRNAMPRRVLIVEDESLLVMVLEDVLPALGCEVAATAHSVESALAALADDDRVDLAILDVNLAGDDSFPIADALHARGIPFFFATGYGASVLPERHADAPLIKKPYGQRDLEAALARMPQRPPLPN